MDIPRSSEQEAAVSEARSHVARNIVAAKEGRACVDGRYPERGVESGFLSRPGGDFGFVMGLLALRREGKIDITPEQAVETVYGVLTRDGDKFYTHTDSHSVHERTLTGCGHVARATGPQFADKYGVDPADVVKALNRLRYTEDFSKLEEAELQGDHAEKGVLIVRGNQKTVDHQDAEGMYFVYDKDRDEALQEKIVNEVNVDGLNIEDFRKALEKQTMATVGLLAAGKPVIEADLTGGKPNLKYLMTVPPSA